jgi:hypothetical protein
MNEYLFSVFKRSDRPFYLVSFKDNTGKYLPPLSTKRRTEAEAVQTAFQWLRDGVPREWAKASQALNVNQLALRDIARKIEARRDVEIIIKEIKKPAASGRGMLFSEGI